MKKWLLIILLPLFIHAASEEQLRALFHSLNPHSISELFAFYELYPDSSFGQQAKKKAWDLLTLYNPNPPALSTNLQLPDIDLSAIIQLVNQRGQETKEELNEEALSLIETLAHFLPNRRLKGHFLWDKESIKDLPESEVDLSRALLVYEDLDPLAIRRYEAVLDIMTLEIMAKFPPNPSIRDKIKTISHYIFYEQGFRFPPHSLYAADIDLYTFLPSVLDGHQGVCLGVSILYLCLAQRLDIHLEIITPPGHIFVRCPAINLNIETTARGIHLEDEVYLGINTRKLKERTIKEVVGLAFFNQAAVFWHRKEYQKVVELYETAQIFLPNDPLLKFFLGLNLLFIGEKERGDELLKEIAGIPRDDMVAAEMVPVDYLNNKVGIEGIRAVFEEVTENRASIEKKQEELRQILKKWPHFRDGWLHLAVTYLQLGRTKEGFESLTAYHQLSDQDPTVEYYLATLSLRRHDYPSASLYLKNCQKLTEARCHHPKVLRELKRALHHLYPE